MSLRSGPREPSRGGAVPLPRELEHTELGAYLHNLEGQVQAMGLELDALRELLQEAGLLSSKGFSTRVGEIDRRDGAEDGRLQHRADQSCRTCNRKLSWSARRCFYCGSTDLMAAIAAT